MRKYFNLLFLLIAFLFAGINAQATTVTIQSTTISNWRFPGTTAQLRIYLRSQMVTSDSFVRLPGSPSGGAVFGQYTCTVAGNVLTIPAVTIDSTTDALVNPAATYSAFFFNPTTGAQLAAYTGFGNFAVPTSPATTSWSALLIYNSTNVPYVDDRSYNRTQIDALIQAAAGAPSASPFLTTTAAPALSSATNLGALASGIIKISVSGGVATPAIAVAGTDFLAVGGSGAGLTNLNASNLSSGTVADNRLSANVTLLGSTIDVSGSEIAGVLKAGSFPALTGDVNTVAGALATTIAGNAVGDAKLRQSAGLSIVGRGGNSTGNVADITAGSDFQILRRNGTSIAFGAIDLGQTAAVGASILSVANGGTGSASKNFIDLSNPQTAAGDKTWSGVTTFVNIPQPAGAQGSSSAALIYRGAIGTAASPVNVATPGVYMEIIKTGGTNGNASYGWNQHFIQKDVSGFDTYPQYLYAELSPDYTGMVDNVAYFSELNRVYGRVNPSNIGNRSLSVYGFSVELEKLNSLAGIRAIYSETRNSSGVDADTSAFGSRNTSWNLVTSTTSANHNTGIMYHEGVSNAGSAYYGEYWGPESVVGRFKDSTGGTATLQGLWTANSGSSTVSTTSGTGGNAANECEQGAWLLINGTWARAFSCTANSITLTTTFSGSSGTNLVLTKAVSAWWLRENQTVMALNHAGTSRNEILRYDENDRIRLGFSFIPVVMGSYTSYGNAIAFGAPSDTLTAGWRQIIYDGGSGGRFGRGVESGYMWDVAPSGYKMYVNSSASPVLAFTMESTSAASFSSTLAVATSLSINGGTALTTTNRTGTGNLVLANSPSLVTPNIGAASGTSLTVAGDLTQTGSARRLIVDTSSGTIINRWGIQASSGNIVMSVLPASGSSIAAIRAFADNDPTNINYGGILVATNAVAIESSANGTGTTQPIILRMGGSDKVTLTAVNFNLKIAGNAVRGTTEGTNHFDIFDGTSPVGTLTNGISLYSASGNLLTMNAAGDAVPLSAGKAGRVTAQTAAAASVAAFTVGASDASFEVSANVLVTTATTHTFTVTCTYTDEGNTSRTLTLPFTLVAGGAIVTSIANANGAVPYMGIRQHIRAKSGTTITIATTGTFTSVSYNAEGIIRQIN